jgi:hypothetical protein
MECSHAVQNLLSSHLIPGTVKIELYKNIISLVGLCVCEIWSLKLREEYGLRYNAMLSLECQ